MTLYGILSSYSGAKALWYLTHELIVPLPETSSQPTDSDQHDWHIAEIGQIHDMHSWQRGSIT